MSYVIKAVLSNPRNPECGQATVITDFSNLEAVGRSHFLTVNGGSARMEELENLDGEETAHLLIDGGGEVVTPYGVVYDNGMVLGQEYNGCQFPAYLYDSNLMVLEVTPKLRLAENDSPEYLYLPASERQIERTLLRVGITAPHNAQVRLDSDELPERVAKALDLDHLSGDDLPTLNKMCQAIASLNEANQDKQAQKQLIGRVSYASGEHEEFTDPQKYLQTVREELPYADTIHIGQGGAGRWIRHRAAPSNYLRHPDLLHRGGQPEVEKRTNHEKE